MHSDTCGDANRVQIALIRKMTVAEKLAQVWSLSDLVISLSRRAIARANPQMSSREVDLKFVELHYGKDLAAGLADRLRERDNRERP